MGHEAGGSQVSPLSTTPLLQLAEQSESFATLHPLGQQPSPPVQAVMTLLLHATLQLWALPVSSSRVQALPSSQPAGHVSGGSQVSPKSTTPLPQTAPGAPPVPEVPPPAAVPPPPVAPPLVVTPPVVPAAPPLPEF